MRVTELEKLSSRLHDLRNRLASAPMTRDTPLTADSAYVEAARACDFMLPAPLTVGTLAETVDRKIINVSLLLERARTHDDLPESARTVADLEAMVTEEDCGREMRPRTPRAQQADYR